MEYSASVKLFLSFIYLIYVALVICLSDTSYKNCKVSWETERESTMVFFLYLFLIRRVKVHRQDFNICCTGACALGTCLHWLSESCRFRSGLFTHCRRISAGFEQEVPQTHHQKPRPHLPGNSSISSNRQMLQDYPYPNIPLLPRVVINMLAFVHHLSSSCCLTAHQNQPHEILLKTRRRWCWTHAALVLCSALQHVWKVITASGVL